jgi:hypothetical protein
MRVSPRQRTAAQRGVFRLAALLAFVAQLILAIAPLAEGRDGVGMAAHVEAPGATTHFTHNEATCAACSAQSLHATAVRRTPMFVPVAHEPRVTVAAVPLAPSVDLTSHLFSRAPPSVI